VETQDEVAALGSICIRAAFWNFAGVCVYVVVGEVAVVLYSGFGLTEWRIRVLGASLVGRALWSR
jgi:hypothetical protein